MPTTALTVLLTLATRPLLQPGPDASGQLTTGYIAAAVIAICMVAYVAVIFATRRVSRARLDDSTYPTNIEDVPPTLPLPESLAPVDALLTQAGFTLDSERRGLHSADGSQTPSWHYLSADSTIHALIALSANGKDLGMLLASYLADETQLTTRLSRSLPAIVQPGYESHSVENLDDIVRVHTGHLQRLAAAHGSAIRTATAADEHALGAKFYGRNMGYMFDAMWRRNVIWVAIIEGIGLVALVGGLIQLLNPAISPVKGLAVLIGGAVLLFTLTLTGLASLLRISHTPSG